MTNTATAHDDHPPLWAGPMGGPAYRVHDGVSEAYRTYTMTGMVKMVRLLKPQYPDAHIQQWTGTAWLPMSQIMPS